MWFFSTHSILTMNPSSYIVRCWRCSVRTTVAKCNSYQIVITRRRLSCLKLHFRLMWCEKKWYAILSLMRWKITCLLGLGWLDNWKWKIFVFIWPWTSAGKLISSHILCCAGVFHIFSRIWQRKARNLCADLEGKTS